MKSKLRWTLFVAAVAMASSGSPIVRAQTRGTRPPGPRPAKPAGTAAVIQAAGDALGMLRFVSREDAFGSMEFVAAGTTAAIGPAEYYGSLSYVDNAMRVVLTPAAPAAAKPTSSKPMPHIEVVNGSVAWNESELGAGLVPGQGVATMVPGAAKERLLLLWTLPYGIVKAAAAAGDQAKVTQQAGATVISFPLFGELTGITVTATLDAKNLITKVSTASNDPALVTETAYSLYKEFDTDGVTTNILFPGRLVRTQGGRTVFDIRTKSTNTNNPYEIFRVPASVKAAAH